MAGGEEGPAVGASFGDVERFAGAERVQDGQVVDAALGARGEAETRQTTHHEIPILHAHQLALLIIIRYLEPGDALLVAPRGEATPADHSGIEPTFLEEETAGFCVQERVKKETLVVTVVEGLGRLCLARLVFRQDDVVLVREPLAGLEEGRAKHLLCQIDCPSMRPAGKATEGVAADGKGEAGVVVVVEGAEAFVAADAESESLRDPLNRKVAKLLQFILFHLSSTSLSWSTVQSARNR